MLSIPIISPADAAHLTFHTHARNVTKKLSYWNDIYDLTFHTHARNVTEIINTEDRIARLTFHTHARNVTISDLDNHFVTFSHFIHTHEMLRR